MKNIFMIIFEVNLVLFVIFSLIMIAFRNMYAFYGSFITMIIIGIYTIATWIHFRNEDKNQID